MYGRDAVTGAPNVFPGFSIAIGQPANIGLLRWQRCRIDTKTRDRRQQEIRVHTRKTIGINQIFYRAIDDHLLIFRLCLGFLRRNFQARLNLRAMRVGDPVLYYHSITEKTVVGVAVVARAAYPDPTAPAGEDWSCVDLRPRRALPTAVTLLRIKSEPLLREMVLLKNSRLSVQPLTATEFACIVKMGGISG